MKAQKSEKNKRYQVIWADKNGVMHFKRNLCIEFAFRLSTYLYREGYEFVKIRRDFSNEDNRQGN